MTKLLLAFTVALTASASTAIAAEPGVGYGGSVGALTLETRGVATNVDQVRSQRGFATAGAVHWTQLPQVQQKLGAAAY